MSWSFSEIRSLSVKATRGAGLPWGLAEEAGFAVEWLERNGIPGSEALAAYVEETEANASFTADQCPITQGTWISDSGSVELPENLSVFQPVLLIPFLSLCCGRKDLSLAWSRGSATFTNTEILECSGEVVPATAEMVTLKPASVTVAHSEPTTRVPENRRSAVVILNRFAAKTYAPATEESRLAGAGAGTTDND